MGFFLEDKSDKLLCFLERRLEFSERKPLEKAIEKESPFSPLSIFVLMPVDDINCF